MYDDLTRVVPAQAPTESPCKLAFVGEAPGDEEVEKFRPFVGPSGRVFNALLRCAGISREECLVTNLYDTKLTDNSVPAHRAALGADGWSTFHARNVERLRDELAKHSPVVTVPLGGTALQALAGSGCKISAYRGHPTPASPPFSPRKLVPALHPAAIIRDWRMFVPTIGDFLRAAREGDAGRNITRPKRSLWLDPTIDEVEAFCDHCLETDIISADIETGWGLIRGFSFAPNAEEGIYIPFIDLRKANKSYWDLPEHEVRAWRAVKRVLESPVPKLGQNFSSYDITWIMEITGFKIMNFRHELRVLHKALYPELPASLEFMAGAYSQQGAWKAFAEHGGKKANRSSKRDQ